MTWNMYFEQAAFILSLVLLISYILKHHLPFRAWTYFSWLIFLELVCTSSNIMACTMSSDPLSYGKDLVYLANIGFYTTFVMQIWTFAIYTIAMTGRSRTIIRLQWIIVSLPFVIMEIISLTTPLTHLLFYIDENGNYIRGTGYVIVWTLFLAFYVIVPLSFAWYYKTVMTPKRMLYTIGFWILILNGIILQGLFLSNILLEGFYNALAILIIYIDIQNPAMYMDADTGLFNQWALGEVLEEKIKYKQPISMVFVGIQDFQMLETIYGRAALMKAVCKIGDDLARVFPYIEVFYIHRGRFALLSRKKLSKEEFEKIGKAIRVRFEQPWQMEQNSIIFHSNMVYLPEYINKNSIKEVFELASRAISAVENKYDTSVIYISDEMMQDVEDYFRKERAVNKGIREDAVRIYYQPIFSVKEGKIVYAEALARMSDDKLGEISPQEFIKIAEQNGNIDILGQQIFAKVCRYIKDRDVSDMGIRSIGVNLSPVQCKNPMLETMILGCMERFEIDPSMINFEITESAIADKNVLDKKMKNFIEKGLKFSLDDYGTGYSNLIQVLDFPFQIVKIDKSIVWSYFNGKAQVLPGIISTFSARGYKIVAEGVETKEMVDELSRMGCDYLQGYYYSRPLSGDDFAIFMYDHNRVLAMEQMHLI